MFRDFLTNKWILGGIAFLIVFAVACVLWYRYDTADDRKAAADAEKLLRQREASYKTMKTSTAIKQRGVPHTASMETTPANGAVNTTGSVSETADNSKSQKTASDVKTDAAVPVSPYGFGPYPPLPPGWRGTPEKTWNNLSANHELLKRVRIKLISQGIDVRGASMKYGKVYPIIKGICYVRWETENTPMGEYRYIAGSTGHPDDGKRLRAIREAKFNRGEDDDLTEADIPPDIKLVPYEEGGIDPYEFLGLTPP